MQTHYTTFILTNHAIERMKLRRITSDMIQKAIVKPDERKAEADGDIQFIRKVDGRALHVVARYLDDEKKWLVKSTWVRGEDDPIPFWQRLLKLPLDLLRQLFGGKR